MCRPAVSVLTLPRGPVCRVPVPPAGGPLGRRSFDLPPPVLSRGPSGLLATAAQYDKYQYLYEYTENPNENLVEFINELEQILPSSFWTNSFSSDMEGSSMSVTVEGKAAAARTILNIRNMESIEDVQISNITDSKDEAGKSTVTFSITGTYKALTDESAEQTDTLTVQ